jgi:hypothetical protein
MLLPNVEDEDTSITAQRAVCPVLSSSPPFFKILVLYAVLFSAIECYILIAHNIQHQVFDTVCVPSTLHATHPLCPPLHLSTWPRHASLRCLSYHSPWFHPPLQLPHLPFFHSVCTHYYFSTLFCLTFLLRVQPPLQSRETEIPCSSSSGMKVGSPV